MVKRTIEKINSDNLWESIAKNYQFIEASDVKQLYYTNGFKGIKRTIKHKSNKN